jgi:antitoxin component YwqK of YwqJK toxin-antitoxin module
MESRSKFELVIQKIRMFSSNYQNTRIIVFLLLVMNFYSCQKEKVVETYEGSTKIENFYKGDWLFKEIKYFQDSSIDYSIYKYYENGNIKSEYNYKNDSLFGPSNEFYKSGNLRILNYWVKNKKWSSQFEGYDFPNDTFLYPNNEIGIEIGKISKYEEFSLNGKLVFFISYDTNSIVNNMSDFGIIQEIRNAKYATTKTSYFMLVYVPCPPYSDIEVDITKIKLDNIKEDTINFTFSMGEIELYPVFQEKGDYDLRLITRIDFYNEDRTIIDTTFIPVTVVE